MRQPGGTDPLALADHEAATPADREVLASGWKTEPSGANVLVGLCAGCRGPGARPGDLTGYEAAVNGRGLWDQDLTAQGGARERELLVRAVSYAVVSLSLSGDDVHRSDWVTAAPLGERPVADETFAELAPGRLRSAVDEDPSVAPSSPSPERFRYPCRCLASP